MIRISPGDLAALCLGWTMASIGWDRVFGTQPTEIDTAVFVCWVLGVNWWRRRRAARALES
jgi:hypothetical protein